MKTHKNKLILILFIACIFNSCRKKEIININNSSSISQFFKQNIVPSQFFTINASNDSKISGNKGTQVTFKAGSLKTPAGTIVSGNVEIELKEIYTKGDMILSGIFPLSINNLLISGGEIFLRAKQNGIELIVNDTGGIITVKMPCLTTDTTKMYVYYSDSLKLSLNDERRWGPQGNQIARIPDSMGIDFYVFNIENMKWINCDYQWGVTPLTTVSANTTDTSFNAKNTKIFISFKGINTAADLHQTQTGKYNVSSIPINKEVTFVAIAEKNGQYYSSFVDAKIVNNHTQNITLAATTLVHIKAQLAILQ